MGHVKGKARSTISGAKHAHWSRRPGLLSGAAGGRLLSATLFSFVCLDLSLGSGQKQSGVGRRVSLSYFLFSLSQRNLDV